MHERLTTDTSHTAQSATLLVIALLIVDSLHFVFARLLLPYLSPGVSAMYVLAIGTIQVGLFGLIRGGLHFSILLKYLWFFMAIGFLVATSTNIH